MLAGALARLRTHRRRLDLVALAVFVTLRLAAVIGRPIVVLPDSLGYGRLDLTGSDSRLWPVPLLYAIAQDDATRVLVQTVLSCAAWVLLAAAARRAAPHLVFAAPLAVLVLGLTPQVTRWDQAILSESFGISIAVVAIACWLMVSVTGANGWWLGAAAASVVFGMTRAVQLSLLVLLAAIVVTLAVRRRNGAVTAGAVVLALGAVLGLVMLRNNHGTSTLNLYTVLSERVVDDPAARAWFVERGMPWDDAFVDSRQYVFVEDLPAGLAEYLDLPPEQAPPKLVLTGGFELARWVRDHGWSTYVGYLADRPWSALTGELDRLGMMLDPSDAQLLALHPRSPVPRVVFGYWAAWSAGALVAVTAAVRRAGVRRAGGAGRALAVPVGVVGMCAPWFYAVSLTSGLEHGRHAITLAVCLRVGALLTVLVSWDRLLAHRRGPTLTAAAPRRGELVFAASVGRGEATMKVRRRGSTAAVLIAVLAPLGAIAGGVAVTASQPPPTEAPTTPPDAAPPATVVVTAGCDGGAGFVEAVVTASVDLVDVRLELYWFERQSTPLAVETLGDVAAGTTRTTRWPVTAGSSYSVTVLAGEAELANGLDGTEPCEAPPSPAPVPASPTPAPLPATR